MYPECLAKTSVLRIREDLQALCDTVPCLPFLHTPHPQYLSISFSQTPCLFLSFKHSLFWLCHLLSVWTAFLYVFVLLTLSLHSGFRNFSQEKFFLSLRSSEELPSLGCLPETPFPLVFSTLNLPLSVILTHMPQTCLLSACWNRMDAPDKWKPYLSGLTLSTSGKDCFHGQSRIFFFSRNVATFPSFPHGSMTTWLSIQQMGWGDSDLCPLRLDPKRPSSCNSLFSP